MASVDFPLPQQVAVLCGGDARDAGLRMASARAGALALARLGHRATLVDIGTVQPEGIDWSVYQVCHVAIADDGRWHRWLESRHIPHTGSAADALELSASRSAARQYFLRFDVPTPACVLLRSTVSPLEAVARVASLGYPLLVRPDDRRWSDVRAVHSADELLDTLSALQGGQILCERLLRGRAYSVILQGEHALPPVPASADKDEVPLTESERQTLEHVSAMAGAALGLTGLVQVEVVLDERGRPWVLEANPLPDLTEHSAAARAGALAGQSLADLWQWMMQDCVMVESLR